MRRRAFAHRQTTSRSVARTDTNAARRCHRRCHPGYHRLRRRRPCRAVVFRARTARPRGTHRVGAETGATPRRSRQNGSTTHAVRGGRSSRPARHHAAVDACAQVIPASAVRIGSCVCPMVRRAHGPGSSGDPWRAACGGIAACRRPRVAAHLLFASRDEGRSSPCDSRTGGTRGPLDDAALHALESGRDRGRDSVVGRAEWRSGRGKNWRHSGHAIVESEK
jgi:hypothetical protein